MQHNGLTIGIPVYNEAARVAQAIRCAAPQCERLIVADNASSDGTETVCRELLGQYANMEYVRQAQNIGARGNWADILGRTTTPYIMFLGSHDRIDDNYASTVLPVLEQDAGIEIATGELYFEYGTRMEPVSAYAGWTGGMAQSASARIQSFLFERAHLAWGAYGIFRTGSFRAEFTDALPDYGIDIIFLTRILKRGRFRIVRGTRYYAWKQEQREAKSAYLERVAARKLAKRERLRLRNTFRVAQHDALAQFFTAATPWEKMRLRFRCMQRFGTFRRPGPDPAFFLLYLPVKLARKFGRSAR